MKAKSAFSSAPSSMQKRHSSWGKLEEKKSHHSKKATVPAHFFSSSDQTSASCGGCQQEATERMAKERLKDKKTDEREVAKRENSPEERANPTSSTPIPVVAPTNDRAPAAEPEAPAPPAVATCSPVAPTNGQTINDPGASNDCLPSTSSAVLDWNVVSADAHNWGICVSKLTLKGTINIKPWPSHPTTMTVKNTANPVDGGNINNVAGSDNHFQHAIDDMEDYNKAGGGAGPDWHSTAASRAHEMAHWNIDYVRDSVNLASAGNWPKVNADINALREPKASSANKTDAKTALQPRVDALIASWTSRTISAYNALPDRPGAAGGAGYVAGQNVLDGLIASVKAYKTTKGW